MSKPKVKDFNYVSSKKYDGMMGRCYRTKDPVYPSYGGRNIKVCAAWIRDINSFRAWLMSELERSGVTTEFFVANSKTLQLDRIDTNGHYTPANCRLSNPQANTRNRRVSIVGKTAIVSAEGETIQL